jgi:hypothetical protein
MPACHKCIHFADVRPPHLPGGKAQHYGQCCRLPPTVHIINGQDRSFPTTEWPVVAKDDRCGEFKGNAVTHPFWDENDLATD